MADKTVLFVGDTAPRRADLDSMFEKTRAYLQDSDLLFGQLEAVVTDRGAPACQCRLPMRISPAGKKRSASSVRQAAQWSASSHGKKFIQYPPPAYS